MACYVRGCANKPISNHALILDLDQTLLSTQEGNLHLLDQGKAHPELSKRIYHLTAATEDGRGNYDFWGVTRPGAMEFLQFCFGYFRVIGIWSAGTYNYVHGIVGELFERRLSRKPHLVLTRRDVIGDINNQIFKPLTKIHQYNEVFSRYTSPYNTFILDDNYETASYNRDNIINISAYDPHPSLEGYLKEEDSLAKLQRWLSSPHVINSADVRQLDKKLIFSQY